MRKSTALALLLGKLRGSGMEIYYFYTMGVLRVVRRRAAQGMGPPWSERGSRGALDDQSVEEIFERYASGLVCSPVRAKPGFTKPDAHRPALAPDLPGPILTCIAGPGHDDVKGSSWRRAKHQLTRAATGAASRRF